MRLRTLAPTVALFTLAASCESDSVGGPGKALDEHLKAWRQVEPAAYEFEYADVCFCADAGMWWRIQVNNRAFVSATLVDPSTPAQRAPRRLTMDSVFAEARKALADDKASVSIDYDALWHNPSAIRVDPRANLIDDEWQLLIRGVKSVP